MPVQEASRPPGHLAEPDDVPYASGLIASGCDGVTVQRALGRAKATTPLSVYAHLWPTAEDRTRRAAQAMSAEVLDAAALTSRTPAVAP